MLSPLGCVSSPSGPNASSSKKTRWWRRSRGTRGVGALLLVRREHGPGRARLQGVDDVDRPLTQGNGGRRRHEVALGEEAVAAVGRRPGRGQHSPQRRAGVTRGRTMSSRSRRRSSYGAKPASMALMTRRSISAQSRSNAVGDGGQLGRRHDAAHQAVVGVDADARTRPAGTARSGGRRRSRRRRSGRCTSAPARGGSGGRARSGRAGRGAGRPGVVVRRRVAAEPDAVADAVGAVDDGVVDQLEVGWLAGVDRDVEVALAGERQRLGVQRRRAAGLGAGEVEADDLRRRRWRTRSTRRAISSERWSVRIAQQMS